MRTVSTAKSFEARFRYLGTDYGTALRKWLDGKPRILIGEDPVWQTVPARRFRLSAGWTTHIKKRSRTKMQRLAETLSAIDDAWQVRHAPADPEFPATFS